MIANPYQSQLDEAILEADPLELVVLLYGGVRKAIRSARRHLHEGDIRSRSRQISRAVELMSELSTSLDHTKGGELSVSLAKLYDYVVRLLNEANLQQTEGPLAEADQLLATLEEAWRNCRSAVATASLASLAKSTAETRQPAYAVSAY